MVYKLLIKSLRVVLFTRAHSETLATRDKFVIKSEIMANQQLAKELHKPIIHLIFLVNMHGLFLSKTRKVLKLLILFKIF